MGGIRYEGGRAEKKSGRQKFRGYAGQSGWDNKGREGSSELSGFRARVIRGVWTSDPGPRRIACCIIA